MKIGSLEELYLEEIKDLYDAEKQIIKALPKMAKAASSSELKRAFEEHLEQTKRQVSRLERIFEGLGEKPKASKCEGVRGIIEEGEDMADADASPSVCDAALISAAQKVEHYEIAAYGTVRTYAQTLGHRDHVSLLQQTLEEERETDKKLTSIAESFVNASAARAA